MNPTQRRGALVAILLAVVGAIAAFVVWRSAIGGPTESAVASASESAGAVAGGPVIPAVDLVPWAGVTWSRVPEPFNEAEPTPIRMDGLLNADGLLIGWGRASAEGRNQFNDMGAVFVSGNGRAWRTILIDEGVGAADTSEITGVVQGPRGLLAFGGVCCETETRAVWHSEDGVDWRRLKLAGDLAPRASYFSAVIGLADGWVAVGSEGLLRAEARIWTSPDGATWTAVDPEESGLTTGTIADVGRGPSGLVAVGTIDDAAGTHDGGIWVSPDGRSWERVGRQDPALADPEETELKSVIPFAGGLFVTGNYGTHEDRRRCEDLLGALASTDPLPPRSPTALSCGWGREHHWVSVGGATWERVDPWCRCRDPRRSSSATWLPAGRAWFCSARRTCHRVPTRISGHPAMESRGCGRRRSPGFRRRCFRSLSRQGAGGSCLPPSTGTARSAARSRSG